MSTAASHPLAPLRARHPREPGCYAAPRQKGAPLSAAHLIPSPGARRRWGLLGLVVAPLALGCDPDCNNPSRLDGRWAVTENAGDEEALVTGFQEDEPQARNELLASIFANGESAWELTYVPNRSSFTLRVNDQPYEASYTEGDGSCNAFSLDFSGIYTSTIGGQHDFTWTGELVWSGDELNGVYSYEDSWTWEERSGTVSIPDGQLRAAALE